MRSPKTTARAAGFLVLAIAAGVPVAESAAADRWTGTTNGPGGLCVPFTFDVTVDGARLSGHATTQASRASGAVLWDAAGRIDGTGAITATAKTQDPRIQEQHRTTVWKGQLSQSGLTLGQSGSVVCNQPRVTTMTRR